MAQLAQVESERGTGMIASAQTVLDTDEPFRLFVEAVKDYAIFILDVDGNVITWNVGAERIKGYTASQVIGTHFSRFYTEEDRASDLPACLLAAAKADGHAESEGWRVREDGTCFWANVVITPLYDNAGRLRGFGKVTRDLTSRRHAESLQKSENRLNDFVAMLSHELRNPLAPIINALDLIRRTPGDDHASMLSVIGRQVSQLSRLTDDLLDVGRLTRGKVVLKNEILELSRLVSQATEACQPLIDARKHTIELHCSEARLLITGDATRIVQVVVNLIANAAKYTPFGGHISISTSREGSDAVLRVKDTGIGVPADLHHSIFEVFFQGERSVDAPEGGLGIGLALVKRLVEMHGGSVSVASDGPDRGSEFVVRIPAAAEPGWMIDSAPVAEPHPPVAPLRVFVVDDNRDYAATLDTLLTMAGHEVCTVSDSATALPLATDFRPDVVLMDIGLPGMNGYDLARNFRSAPGLEATTLIALTGYGQPDDRRRGLEAGFNGHVVKPVEIADLLKVIEQSRARR